MKEEPDASTPFHVFEDLLEDNNSSRYIYYNKEAYSKMILQLVDIASKSKDIELSNFLFFET